jgi:hypothetical protein
MPPNFSANAHFYILLFLFTVLFVLQVWALIKIKQMLGRVLEIYAKMQQAANRQRKVPDNGSHLQPSPSIAVNYRRICQYCRYRETFLEASGKNNFIYRCGLNKQEIKLDDRCPQFEFDPQRAEI